MGTLRTIFALLVIFAHTWFDGMVFVGGQIAVQLFYIISGFLISYVLVESKVYPGVIKFYINRYLRIFPVYICVAAITGVALMFSKHAEFFEVYRNSPPSALVLLVLSNSFIFLQDWVLFLGVEGGSLVFVQNFHNSSISLVLGLLIPQAWTLGLELSFYLVAPFVLPRRKLLISLIVFSIILRVALMLNGIGTSDPWTYRFFPTELALFLIGALSQQVLLPMYRRYLVVRLELISTTATLFLIILSLSFHALPFDIIIKSSFLFVVFVFLLPFTFIFQNKNEWDVWIGNLSYPIYIGHMLIVWVVSYLAKFNSISDVKIVVFLSIFGSVIFAITLNTFVGKPFEKIRYRIKGSK